MTPPSITADELRAAIPSLRAFAMSLCGNRDYADDLVQDTLMRAWAKMDRFQAGTNLHAWLFTILRHAFYSDRRKRRREVEDAPITGLDADAQANAAAETVGTRARLAAWRALLDRRLVARGEEGDDEPAHGTSMPKMPTRAPNGARGGGSPKSSSTTTLETMLDAR